MKSTINYSEAYQLWDKYLKTESLRLHTRESEMVMRKLARFFTENEEFWGICGLLHDLDLDLIGKDYSTHGKTTVEVLKTEGYDIPKLFEPIIAHAEGVTDAKRVTNFDFILAAAENITGIISAYVMILPDKKLKDVKVKSIKKRLKQLRFAASVNREFIYDIEKTGISIDKFIELAIEAMAEIAEELGM